MLLISHGSLNSRARLAGWICDVGTDYRQGGRTYQHTPASRQSRSSRIGFWILCGSGWLSIPFESYWIRVLDWMC